MSTGLRMLVDMTPDINDQAVEIENEVDGTVLTFENEVDADDYALTGDETLVASVRPA